MTREIVLSGWSGRCAARTRLVDFHSTSPPTRPCIARGAGRSFGDASFVTGGLTLSTLGLRHLDLDDGVARCGAGVTVGDLFQAVRAMGAWGVPVAGGTRWVTVGGAVAADIHGKDDPTVGSFGQHVTEIDLTVASGATVTCSPSRHPDLFAATIGGMGLTGIIRGARVRLLPNPARQVRARTRSVRDVLSGLAASDADLGMGWVDLAGGGRAAILHQAWYLPGPSRAPRRPYSGPVPRLPLLNRWTVPWLNRLVFLAHRHSDRLQPVEDFHFPVDACQHANRLYGAAGFLEYQFVVPEAAAEAAWADFLRTCARVRPYHVVVKRFGNAPRAGLLSFPMPGFTFTALFSPRPDPGPALHAFTESVMASGGRISLVKDSCLPPEQVERMYPRLEEWRAIVRRWDPGNVFQSNLSRRLGLKPW